VEKTGRVTGRVMWDDEAPAGFLPLRVTIVNSPRLFAQRIETTVDQGGRFAVEGVGPGVFDVFVENLPDRAFVSSIRLGVLNGFDHPIPLRGVSSELEIHLSAKGVHASGIAVTATGQPITGAEVILVPNENRNREDRFLRT